MKSFSTQSVFFAITALALLYLLIEGHALGWPIWLAGLLVLSIFSTITLLRLQLRRAENDRPQLIPIAPLADVRFLVRVGFVTFMFVGIGRTHRCSGSGALQAFQQIGIALGIALVGQVFFMALGDSPDAMSYIAALKTALWVPITLFAGLSLISSKLNAKEHRDATA